MELTKMFSQTTKHPTSAAPQMRPQRLNKFDVDDFDQDYSLRNSFQTTIRSIVSYFDKNTTHETEKGKIDYSVQETPDQPNCTLRSQMAASQMYELVSQRLFGPVGDGDISAGHVGRYISLANPDRLSRNLCHLPIGILGVTFGLAILGMIFWIPLYIFVFAILSVVMYFFCVHMGLGTLFGVYKMRQSSRINWTRQWDDFLMKNPGIDDDMLHIVILPNYKEDEQMLSQTVSNLAQSDLAIKYMILVLAMEKREGESGRAKVERLIARHKNQFKEMFATYHPENIPCEVAGKSSNTQWAFREVQRWYGSYVSRFTFEQHDTSKIFLTIADADSLHHKDYFTSLSIQALSVHPSQRSWTIWQPPILLLRNFETVPSLVRSSAYSTLWFEIAGLSFSNWFDHCCFSAYSLTLSLANHPMVDGWDADVIAEDHHMYMKCMMASYWEEIFSKKRVENISKLNLKPVWLPVTSYLAEDSRGYWASVYARFQQARRHSQGVAELSYIVLQYLTIIQEFSLPLQCHLQMWGMIQKYCTIHLWAASHALLTFMTTLFVAYWAMQSSISGALGEKVFNIFEFSDGGVGAVVLVALATFSPTLGVLLGLSNYFIVKDSLEGRYCPLYLQSVCDPERANKKVHKLSIREMGKLSLTLLYDMYVSAFPCLVMYSTVPSFLACWSMSRQGHKFDYIVAAKPETQISKKGADEELDNFASDFRE